MTTTAFSTIAAAVVTTLTAAAVAQRVERARPRNRPVPEQESSAVVVRLISTDGEAAAILGAPRDWETVLAVECYARGTVDSGDELVDPIVYAVHAALAADTTLGGVAGEVELQSIRWGTSAEADRAGDAALIYRVRHRTTNLNLSTAP